MGEQLKALLEGINALKSSQEETKERMQKGQQEMQKSLEDMQKSQEETKNELKQEMQKCLDDTKNELKERMEKGQEETKKGQKDLKNSLEKKIDTVEEKINSVEEKITLKVEEKIAVVEERIKEQVEEKIEEVAENFSLISQRVEDLEKKLLVSNGWTEGVKACQLAASLRGEAAEILQTLPDTERLNLNSLYNALDLRFGQKYSKEYARLQMKTRLQKTGESLQEYAFEVERLANLAFSHHLATVRETISLQYFVDVLREREVQKAVKAVIMADVQDLKSALLYALKLEAATQASRRDRQSIRGARVTTDAPCESLWRKKIEKLREEIQDLRAQRQNLRRRRITFWGCGGAGHPRSSCPRINKEDHNIKCWGCSRSRHVRSNCPRVNQKDPCRTSVTKSKKVCSNRKGSADENGDVRSKRPCPESSKNLSNSLRVEKKFSVIDPVVRQITTPST
ncbi:uncharacterized protein TNCV_4698331 [Trichonephila clavipes]|nr:uncharacterized protein TNCV_4698331 [Trichonephila clavipes]